MAKSIRKMTLDAGNANLNSDNCVIARNEDGEVKMPIKEVVHFKEAHVDVETQRRLDQLEEQNLLLLKEKSQLENKIAEYIEELANLRATDNENLEQTSKVNDMQKEIDNLKNAAAQYLRRISDLTFENANLTVQLKELSSNSTNIQNTIPSMSKRETGLESPVYNPYKQNGYSSWN